jgi:hypothetical protein
MAGAARHRVGLRQGGLDRRGAARVQRHGGRPHRAAELEAHAAAAGDLGAAFVQYALHPPQHGRVGAADVEAEAELARDPGRCRGVRFGRDHPRRQYEVGTFLFLPGPERIEVHQHLRQRHRRIMPQVPGHDAGMPGLTHAARGGVAEVPAHGRHGGGRQSAIEQHRPLLDMRFPEGRDAGDLGQRMPGACRGRIPAHGGDAGR